VKTSAKTAILVLLSTAVAFAESPKQLGAWSIYPGKDNHVVLLQSTSNVLGQPAQAKLDVICRNGKLSAIALEPSAAIQKSRLSFTGAVPTTRGMQLLILIGAETFPVKTQEVGQMSANALAS